MNIDIPGRPPPPEQPCGLYETTVDGVRYHWIPPIFPGWITDEELDRVLPKVSAKRGGINYVRSPGMERSVSGSVAVGTIQQFGQRVLERGRETMGSPHSSADPDQAEDHGGWEVEFLTRGSANGSTVHTAARHYELVAERNESAPTLVLMDESEEPIALYNGLSWVAARRITK